MCAFNPSNVPLETAHSGAKNPSDHRERKPSKRDVVVVDALRESRHRFGAKLKTKKPLTADGITENITEGYIKVNLPTDGPKWMNRGRIAEKS
jgi:hypothetical protein